MEEVKLKFKHNRTPKEFNLVHNLDEYGLNIMDAFHNWTARTNEFTEESFIAYVVSKDVNLACITRRQFILAWWNDKQVMTQRILKKSYFGITNNSLDLSEDQIVEIYNGENNRKNERRKKHTADRS